jgi:hypothetical protein
LASQQEFDELVAFKSSFASMLNRNRFFIRPHSLNRSPATNEKQVESQSRAHRDERHRPDRELRRDGMACLPKQHPYLVSLPILVDGDEKCSITVLPMILPSGKKWPLVFLAEGKTAHLETPPLGDDGANSRSHSESRSMNGDTCDDTFGLTPGRFGQAAGGTAWHRPRLHLSGCHG